MGKARLDAVSPVARTALVTCVALALSVPSVAAAQAAEPYTPPGYETAPPPPPPAPSTEPPPSFGYEQPAPAPGTTYVVVPQPYPPSAPVAPPATHARRVPVERSESIRGLWLPGLIVLPIAWITTWTISSTVFFDDAATFSWIPVLGPWLMLTQDLNGYEAGIVVSGVVQGLAALALVLGLTIRRTYTDYQYVIEPVAVAPGARLTFDAITLPGGGMVGARLEM